MHKLAERAADACVSRKWISEQDKPWCSYAIEKKLLVIGLFVLLIPLSLALNVLPETMIFSVIFYMLRRRFGGWHAPYAWLCQIISISIVLGTVLVVGPLISAWPILAIWSANAIAMILAFVQKPIYQPQNHFTQEIKSANNKKKNQIVLIVLVLQCCLGTKFPNILVYGFLAVLTGVISVYIEVIQQQIKAKEGIT